MNTDSTKVLSDNAVFVNLVRLCQEDKESRLLLLKIITLPDFQRNSLIGSLTHKMRLEKAPIDFITAIEALRISDIAEKTKQMLEREDG